MKSSNPFTLRLVFFLILGVIAYAINDWAREQQSLYIFLLQFICLAAIALADVSRFVSGNLKFRPEETHQFRLLEQRSFQWFLGCYLLLLAVVVLINLSDDTSDFFMSPWGLWLVFLPVMLAAFFISSRQLDNGSNTG